jgi:hypothetical protein
MINTGLISYLLFLLPAQELYRTMSTFMFNALSKNPGNVAAYFIYISFITHTITILGNW